ncbi:MAG: CPBP family glutamic-type intramembrane protease [Nitrososphaeraceae archaeon]
MKQLSTTFCDIKADINPKSWLSKYRRTSIVYLMKMLLFYHGIGLLLMLIGTSIAEKVIVNYNDRSIPRSSLISVLAAGPIEETVFFGIPYYLFGNHFLVLAGGIVWAMTHILNTNRLDISTLAYANWLFVIPSLFFSLRTWISGKGWFAIVTHSIWNGIFFTLGCASGEISCIAIFDEKNFLTVGVSSLIVSLLLSILTYMLYKRKHDTNGQRVAV